MNKKSIVITGASEGIGRALALALAAKKARLVLAARNGSAIADLARECEALGAEAVAAPTDVADAVACRALIQQALEAHGAIDILVNNAGITMRGRVDEVEDVQIFERVMRVNYLGSLYCTHAALPHLKTSHGLIVAVSSLQGKTGFPESSGYCASKFAMQGFFDSLRIELEGSGVGVLIVSPGAVDTAIHARKLETDAHLLETGWQPSKQALMPVEACVRQMIRAMERRDRELVLTLQGKLMPWMRLAAPGILDKLVARAVRQFYT